MHPIPRDISVFWLGNMARWQSGYAADCKSVYLGSTPGRASILFMRIKARVVKLVYTTDSKSVSFGSVGSSPTSGTNSNDKASAHAGALLFLA